MSSSEVKDPNNPQQRLVVRDYSSGAQVQMYYGEPGATWTVDATTQYRAAYASFECLWTIEVTGDDEITVKAGSLVHNGTTYSWPDTTFSVDANGNYQADNLVNGNGGTLIVYKWDATPVFQTQVFMPHLSGVVPDGHNPANTWELGLSEGGAAEVSSTGSGSGDPFVTPIF